MRDRREGWSERDGSGKLSEPWVKYVLGWKLYVWLKSTWRACRF